MPGDDADGVELDIPTRAFTPAVLSRLKHIAGALDRYNAMQMSSMLSLLSALLTKGPLLAVRVFESGVLQTVVRGAPVLLGDIVGDDDESGLWWTAAEMGWLFYRALVAKAPANALTSTDEDDNSTKSRDRDRAKMAAALLDCGAMRYCVETLSAAAVATEPPPNQLLDRMLEALRALIAAGDTSPDPAVRRDGATPRNAFLAVFFEAGGRTMLVRLARNEAVCAHSLGPLTDLQRLVHDIVGKAEYDDDSVRQ